MKGIERTKRANRKYNSNIILIGFMGTGKSTVSKKLSEMLEWRAVDLDSVIVERAGMSIPEIFAQLGEGAFRDTETAALQEVLSGTQQVVATGGGAVLREHNCQAMSGGGLVVALTASADTIVERVAHDPQRPLLQGNAKERVMLLLEQRKGAYDFADLQIDTTALTAGDIARQIAAFAAAAGIVAAAE